MMVDEKADSSFNPSKIGLEMLFFREDKKRAENPYSALQTKIKEDFIIDENSYPTTVGLQPGKLPPTILFIKPSPNLFILSMQEYVLPCLKFFCPRRFCHGC